MICFSNFLIEENSQVRNIMCQRFISFVILLSLSVGNINSYQKIPQNLAVPSILNDPHSKPSSILMTKKGKVSGAEIVVHIMKDLGLKTIWGLPGDMTAFQNAIYQTKGEIEFIPVRHEQQGGFAAQGFAIGKMLLGDNQNPGVVYVSLGPGATNLPTPVANAFQDNTPMIVLVDQLSKEQSVARYHQYVNLKELFGGDSAYARGIAKKVIEVEDARDLPAIMSQAYALAVAEQPGPVVIILREDILQQEVPLEELRMETVKPKEKKSDDELTRLAQQLTTAIESSKFSVAILGSALVRQDVGKEVQAFLERNNIPFFTTLMAKGVIPENHPLCLGPINRHLFAAYKDLFEQADTIVTIGFDIVEGVKPSVWEANGKKRVIHIDEVPTPLPQIFKPDIEIVAPLKRLFKAENKLNGVKKQKIPVSLDHIRERIRERFIGNSEKTRYIARLIEVLRESLPEEVVCVSDVGNHKQLFGLLFPALTPAITFNGLSAIGAALPVSMGIQKANPEATVVAFHGDGGFLLNSPAMQTAKEQGLPIIVVLLDDSAYGMIKTRQVRSFKGAVGVDYTNPDFSQLAKAYGWDYWTPTEDGEPAIRSLEHFLLSLAETRAPKIKLKPRQKPLLIHLPIQYEHSKAKKSESPLSEEEKKIRELVRYFVQEFSKRTELRENGKVQNETDDDLAELRLLIKENLRLDGKSPMAEVFDVSEFPFLGRMGKYPSIQAVRTEMVIRYLLKYFDIDFLVSQMQNNNVAVRWPGNGPVFDWVSLVYRIGEFPDVLTYMKANFLGDVIAHTDPQVLDNLIKQSNFRPGLFLEFMVYAWCRCQGGEWLFNFARQYVPSALPAVTHRNSIEVSV